MPLELEKTIERAFGNISFPFPKDWPPIQIQQEHPNYSWKNFGNKGSILVEEAFLIYALVRLTKPKFALDCGTYMGMSAAWIAQALRDNKLGRIVTVEHHEAAIIISRMFFKKSGYSEIESVHSKIEAYKPPCPIDFLVLDTETKDRVDQFKYLKPYFSKDCWVFFHDAGSIPGLWDLPYPYLHFKTIRECAVFHVISS